MTPNFSSECWYLLMMTARALELYFHPLVSEGWNSLSNRNGGKRWWFGPQTRQTAGPLLLYQLSRPLWMDLGIPSHNLKCFVGNIPQQRAWRKFGHVTMSLENTGWGRPRERTLCALPEKSHPRAGCSCSGVTRVAVRSPSPLICK